MKLQSKVQYRQGLSLRLMVIQAVSAGHQKIYL